MASSRGAANAALYRARTILAAWEQAAGASQHSEQHLIDTFMPAVREHLLQSYGWFLLSVSGVEDARERPPRSTCELPEVEAGKALPPELREFRILEEEGWIGDLIAADAPAAPSGPVRQAAMPDLLGSDQEAPGLAVAKNWTRRLATTMERMDDSLAEC